MNQQSIERAYARVASKNPNIIDQRHLELLTRKYIMRRKQITCGVLVLVGTLLIAIISLIAPQELSETEFSLTALLTALGGLIGGVLVILGACLFAKAMHDPLTPDEIKELAAFDSIEKGGKTDVDLSEFDNTAYLQHEQKKYEKAGAAQRFWLLLRRIPLLIWLIVALLGGGGLFSTISGAHSLMTYEERSAHAVSVTAKLIKVSESYDSTADEKKYLYTYEYTYNGKTYHTKDSSFTAYEIGSTKSIQIDTRNPQDVIIDDGKTTLITGVVLLLISIVVLIYSLFSVRDPNNSFSLLSLVWLAFVAAAIGFAIWGIATLIGGSWAGLLIILIGCPMCLLGAFLFRSVSR